MSASTQLFSNNNAAIKQEFIEAIRQAKTEEIMNLAPKALPIIPLEGVAPLVVAILKPMSGADYLKMAHFLNQHNFSEKVREKVLEGYRRAQQSRDEQRVRAAQQINEGTIYDDMYGLVNKAQQGLVDLQGMIGSMSNTVYEWLIPNEPAPAANAAVQRPDEGWGDWIGRIIDEFDNTTLLENEEPNQHSPRGPRQ